MRSSTPATSAPIAELFSAWSAKGVTGARCEVRLGVWGLQERHLGSRINFKLNRAAALAEWRQLLSA